MARYRLRLQEIDIRGPVRDVLSDDFEIDYLGRSEDEIQAQFTQQLIQAARDIAAAMDRPQYVLPELPRYSRQWLDPAEIQRLLFTLPMQRQESVASEHQGVPTTHRIWDTGDRS